MRVLIYIMFLSVFFLEWDLEFIPRVVTLAPELISVFATIYILGWMGSKRRFAVQAKYVLLFVFMSMVAVAGIIANHVSPWVIFNGTRQFAKLFPIFFIPAVFYISDKEMLLQLKWLLFLLFLQFPLAIYQKFFQFGYWLSGDVVGGTLGNSKILSGALIWGIAIAFAFYLRERLSYRRLILIVAVLLVPIMLNSTRGSIFLLPFAFIVPILFGSSGARRKKYLVGAVVSGVIFITGYILVDGYYYGFEGRWGVVSLVTEGSVVEYELDTSKGDGDDVGRLAAIIRAFEILWEMGPTKLLLGVGLGNATDSFTETMVGQYFTEYQSEGIDKHTVSILIWTFGLIGLSLFYLFIYMVYRDARALSRGNDLSSVVALGWLGVLAVFAIQTIYINSIFSNVLGYLAAYFSGYVASISLWKKRILNVKNE